MYTLTQYHHYSCCVTPVGTPLTLANISNRWWEVGWGFVSLKEDCSHSVEGCSLSLLGERGSLFQGDRCAVLVLVEEAYLTVSTGIGAPLSL